MTTASPVWVCARPRSAPPTPEREPEDRPGPRIHRSGGEGHQRTTPGSARSDSGNGRPAEGKYGQKSAAKDRDWSFVAAGSGVGVTAALRARMRARNGRVLRRPQQAERSRASPASPTSTLSPAWPSPSTPIACDGRSPPWPLPRRSRRRRSQPGRSAAPARSTGSLLVRASSVAALPNGWACPVPFVPMASSP